MITTIFFVLLSIENWSIHELSLTNILKGGLAGIATLAITYPADIVRLKLVNEFAKPSDQIRFVNYQDTLKYLYNLGGLRAIYQGFLLSSLGTFIYRGIYFGGYDTMKHLTGQRDREISLQYKYMSALVSTIAGLCASFPIENIRRRMSHSMFSSEPKMFFVNYQDCLHQVLTNEGAKSLFKVNFITIYRVCLGAPLVLVLYDELKTLSRIYT